MSFFFSSRRRHTRSLCDWSSDVCSSDLGDLVRQIADAIVSLNQTKKQHPILICDEAQLLRHPALEQLPLLLNFDMDSSHYLTLLLVEIGRASCRERV